MPNITSKQSSACGNDALGTMCTDHHVHPHNGGHPMPRSGGSVSGRRSMARQQVAKGKAHLHGGAAMGGATMRAPTTNDADADDY